MRPKDHVPLVAWCHHLYGSAGAFHQSLIEHERSGFRTMVILATLLTAAGVGLDQRGWPLYVMTCLLLPAVPAAPRLSGTAVALLSGLGYWWWNRASEPVLLDLVWCLPASVAGWQIHRAPLSALLLVTAAAAATTVFALLPPLPATALVLGSLVGGFPGAERFSADRQLSVRILEHV